MVDAVDIRPLRLGEPTAAVRAQALKEPVHALGVQRADGQRRLARPRHADHRDHPPQRHVNVDVPQVVVPRAAHADERGQGPRYGEIVGCRATHDTARGQAVVLLVSFPGLYGARIQRNA